MQALEIGCNLVLVQRVIGIMDLRRISLPLGLIFGMALLTGIRAQTPASAPDITGSWESTVEAGKFKIRVIVTLTKSAEGKISGKIEIPDQGAKDIPVSAVLCNFPAVRWEIDPFDNTAFNGTLNAANDQIAGIFDEGPGGRPLPAIFKRIRRAGAPAPQYLYTFAPGEPRDIRGYWKATVEPSPGNSGLVGLKIGRAPDGSYEALLALLDRGVQDAVASAWQFTNSTFKLEWQLFRMSFEGTLLGSGDALAGTWKQEGKSIPARFERLDRPAGVLPSDLSFTPESDQDVRGYWQGALQVPGNRLRLLFKIGKTPAGEIAGTLSSLDQGGGEMPITHSEFTNSVLKLEWKPIHGTFKGTLSADGKLLDGTWEQMGMPLPLKLERTTSPEGKKQSE